MAEIDFPSNSKEPKRELAETKREKIVTGNVEVRKKKSFTDTFFGEDVENVGGYILNDVVIPALKNTISDVIGNGIDMLLFGSTSGRHSSIGRSANYVPYSSYSYRGGGSRSERNYVERRSTIGRDRMKDVEDVIFDSRGDAEEVLSQLMDFIVDYGEATVADFYDLAGISCAFTDHGYGWESLDGASVQRDRGGKYFIRFPRVRPLT